MTDPDDGARAPVDRELPAPVRRAVVRPAVDLGRRVGARPALALTLVVGAAVAALLAFLVARVYDAVTDRDGVSALDLPVLKAFAHLRNPATDGFSAGVAYLFGPVGMPIMALAAVALLCATRRSWTPAILVVGAGLGSLLMTIAGKDIIDRSRPARSLAIPPFETSPSFPSGHTLNATVIAGIVAYLLWINRRTITGRVVTVVVPVVIAVVVGLTRVLLAAHWFTDVLAGWLLGATWLAMIITAHRLFLIARRHGAPLEPPGLRARVAARSHR
ncbi:phosphatase PAP2 family protein [Amnibacterium setariae]|uniref:PAP2 family protein n=1 Tax=Amnibacterium setariae TaxID=2306585 RepID=A0A3A1U3C8_9MICO|nr:phosphatase PAP2 family protein [Amnibacterium setariae]RIX31051.1 PAP2 family protein [Amnibacterium setariae]